MVVLILSLFVLSFFWCFAQFFVVGYPTSNGSGQNEDKFVRKG